MHGTCTVHARHMQVRGIIDHHQDERQHLDTCSDSGGARLIDTSAGSACSLVAHEALYLKALTY